MALSPEVRRARRAAFNRDRRLRDRKNTHLIESRAGYWFVCTCPNCSRVFDVARNRPIPDVCPDCQ